MKAVMASLDRKLFCFVFFLCLGMGLLFAFLVFYFRAYQDPYMKKNILDISDGWTYSTETEPAFKALSHLKYTVIIPPDETLSVHKVLDVPVEKAALLFKTNHQTLDLYLDGKPIFSSAQDNLEKSAENPGMAMFFVDLPPNYLGKTLTMNVRSPYPHYAGRMGSVMMGDIPSLEAYTISASMRSLILMSLCLFLGFCTIAFASLQAFRGDLQKNNFALGVFAVLWGLYYISTDYLAYQFFDPHWVSYLSIGFYMAMQVPFSLFLYFSFRNYGQYYLPAVCAHIFFVAAAFTLQALGRLQLPWLLNINNTLYMTSFLLAIILSFLEIRRGNRFFLIVLPFLTIAYFSMARAFVVFYRTRGSVDYNIYKDTFFLLVLVVSVYNVAQFFRCYYAQRAETHVLALQNRLAQESYGHLKEHMGEVGRLKHEMKNHLAALKILLSSGQAEKALDYLTQLTEQIDPVVRVSYGENLLINAVVGELMASAKGKSIRLDLNLNPSKQIGVADPDLFSLLSNILENALSACAKVEERSRRFIELKIHMQPPYLYISCRNSKTGPTLKEGERFLSDKEERQCHGYGLRTVELIAEKYEGMLDIEYDDKVFGVSLALKETPVR